MKNESRSFLLKWLNSLCIPVQRIEDIGKGVALCMLLKKIETTFPAFKKEPVTENDYFTNLKLVQLYFEKRNIKIYFPIEKMIKLKMQDNLEVIQAIYRYVIREAPNLGAKNTEEVISEPEGLREGNNELQNVESEASTLEFCNEEQERLNVKDTPTKTFFSSQNEPVVTTQLQEQLQHLKEQNRNLQSTTEKLRDCATIMQNERNFYFEKLVQIEKFLTETESKEVAKEKILRLLYKI